MMSSPNLHNYNLHVIVMDAVGERNNVLGETKSELKNMLRNTNELSYVDSWFVCF